MKKLSLTLVLISVFFFTITAIQLNTNSEKSKAYCATTVKQKNFNKIKLGGTPKQVLKILGKPTGESSDSSGRRELYYEHSLKKKRVKIIIEIQKVQGKDMVIEKSWVERLR